MLTYGFFDSVGHDRVYNAEQMSNYFEGLVSDGVYQSIGNAFEVTAGAGMNVKVGTGRGIIKSRWVNNDQEIILPISPSSPAYPRYTNIVLRLDTENRRIELATVDGTPASTPIAPTPTRSGNIYELVIAQVIVITGSTDIQQSQIFDTRANSELCGWVASLVQNLDTSTLFEQWVAKYNEQFETFKQAYDDWFEDLTENLNVDTYIQEYSKEASLYDLTPVEDMFEIPLNMTGYTYESGDIIQVFINGLLASPSEDYVLDTTPATPVVRLVMIQPEAAFDFNQVTIKALKSKIGFNS